MDPVVFDGIVESYRVAKREYSLEIKKAKSECWKELLDTLESDSWRKPYLIVLRKLKKGVNACEKMEERELLLTVETLFPRMEQEEEQEEEEETPMVSEKELEVLAKRMMRKRKPAPGPDGISNVTIRSMIRVAHEYVMNVMNECLMHEMVPDEWKKARLVLIRKVGRPEGDPSAYRPLCVLNEIGKFLERIMVKRMEEYIEEKGPERSENQYGFVKNKCTVDALIEVRKIVRENTEEGRFCMACSLDVKNAFNSLTWTSIHEMMRRRNFPCYLKKLMKSYLSDRRLIWIGRDGEKREHDVECGVPQGSILGPLLWGLVYEEITEMELIEDVRIVCYADDTLVMVGGRRMERVRVKMEMLE